MNLLRRLPIKVLDRYLIREFTYSYVVCVLIMISLYVVLDLFANIDEFTSGEKTTRQIMINITSYYFYHSFLYFSQVAGIITLVAAAFTLARLQRGNELTAVLSGGVSLYRVATPLLAAGLGFTALWVVNQEMIIPNIADKLVLRQEEAQGKAAFELYFLKEHGGTLLSAGSYDPSTQAMEQMVAMERDENGELVATITADLATWDPAQKNWELIRGVRQVAGESRDDFVMAARMSREKAERYESDWGPSDMLLRQSSEWTAYLGIRQLNAILDRPNLVPDIREVEAARHVRLTQPLINMLMMFLGLPFFLNRRPSNVLLSVGMCLFVAISCFMFSFVCHSLAGTVSYSELAAWLPILVYAPLASLLMVNIKT
jgi:lipopolysaccharide export system permease protein